MDIFQAGNDFSFQVFNRSVGIFIIWMMVALQVNGQAGDTVKIVTPKNILKQDTRGRYLRINKIEISGNNLTRNSIILRELLVKEGSIINEQELDYICTKAQQRVFNLHLFHTAAIKPVYIDSATIDLKVDVQERWYTFPVPRFQLSDRNFNEWWQNYNHDWSRVNYGLKLYQYNIWGRNHTLLLKAQFGFTRNFQLSF